MKKCLLSFFVWSVFDSMVFAWEEPEHFLGLKWGSSIGELRKQQPGIRELAGRAESRIRSFGVENVLLETVRTNVNYVFLDNGFVCAYVFFDPKDFAVIEHIFTAKYGGAKEVKQNVMSPSIGVEYRNMTLKWEGENIVIDLIRYYGARPDGFAAIGKKSFLHPPPRPIFFQPK